MKRPGNIFILLLFILFFTGCKKDNGPAASCNITKYTVSFNNNGSSAGVATMLIAYDQEGRVTKLNDALETYRVEFDYSGNQCIKNYYNGNIVAHRTIYQLDNHGWIKTSAWTQFNSNGTTSTSFYTYDYSSNGELQKETCKNGNNPEIITTYSWMDGNCMQSKSSQGRITYFTYYTGKPFQGGDGLSIRALEGNGNMRVVQSKNLIKSFSYSDNSDTWKCEYEFDARGNIAKQTTINSFDVRTTTDVYSYEYTCK